MTTIYRTAEESRKENIAAMGQSIGDIYSALWQAVAVLHFRWGAYIELFGTSPERVALLNKGAPSFFHLIQEMLWDDVLLRIACLADASRSMGKDNLSLQRLGDLLRNSAFGDNVTHLIENAVAAANFAKDWRNRKIAHNDLNLAIGNSVAEPLAFASRIKVRDAVTAIDAVLNAVSKYYLDTTTMFDQSNTCGALLNRIETAVRWDEGRRRLMCTRDDLPIVDLGNKD